MKGNIDLRAIVVRLLVALLGIYLLSIFGTPVSVGISNIGNITGIVLALVFILGALLWTYVKRLISFLWKRKLGKGILIVIAVLAGVGVVMVIGISVLLYRGATDDGMFSSVEVNDVGATGSSSDEPVLLVLGCQVRGTTPSLMLCERLDAAYDYMIDHPGAVCIVSGGKGPGEKIPEAECMYNYLVDKGIDGKRIYQENRSTTTAENLTFSKEIMESEGLGTNIAVVTNEFHEYRARRLASKYGLASIPVSAKTAGWLFPTYYVRELYAVPGYFLKY